VSFSHSRACSELEHTSCGLFRCKEARELCPQCPFRESMHLASNSFTKIPALTLMVSRTLSKVLEVFGIAAPESFPSVLSSAVTRTQGSPIFSKAVWTCSGTCLGFRGLVLQATFACVRRDAPLCLPDLVSVLLLQCPRHDEEVPSRGQAFSFHAGYPTLS